MNLSMIMLSIIILLLIMYGITTIENRHLKQDLYSERYYNNTSKNKVSMIEYKLRAYKEQNSNPYTLIRDIKQIVGGEFDE